MATQVKITERELALRKDRIIHIAFRLFCRDGIENASLKDVARCAGVGEKSIYRYFTKKTELVIATIAVLWQEIVSELIASLEEGYEERNGLEQVGCLIDCLGSLFEHYAPYVFFSYESKIFLAKNNARITEELYVDEIRPIKNLYLAALEKGIADGSIRPQENLEDTYYAVWGMMRGYVAKIVIYDRMYQGENVWRGGFELARSLILNGLAQTKGK